ncbi:MAG: hypothetical protein IPO91_18965 [Chloroflexi bacterium]|jgi:hypothetical protein|nr:hypothetical protein [Chloroflexota bacterium]
MDNFYELLDLSAADSREAIEDRLKELDKELKRRVRNKDAKVRNDAGDKQKLVWQAMGRFKSDEDRAAYDKELEAFKKQSKLDEPLIDVDFYAFLDLPITATVDQIRQRIEVLEAQVDSQSGDEQAVRQNQVLQDVRTTLLDIEKRRRYDAQLNAKREFQRRRDREKPVPIIVADASVGNWIALESTLDQFPDEGLFLLQDGEIEAWLRWSLGQKQRAAWTRDIADRSIKSDAPFLEFEEFQRLINPNRPFVLYGQGGHPKQGSPLQLNQIGDVVTLADKHWELFRLRLEYILDWIAESPNETVLEKYRQMPPSSNPDIQLERLLYIIDPQLPAPQALIQGVSGQTIDFGLLSKWERSEHTIEIVQAGRGYLFGTVRASADWLKLSTAHFEGRSSELRVEVVPSKLVAEQDNRCEITFNFLDGRIPPQSLEVLVRQRTAWQSITSVFKRDNKAEKQSEFDALDVEDTQPHRVTQSKSRLVPLAAVLVLLALIIGSVVALSGRIDFNNLTPPAVIQGWERFESDSVALQMPANYGYFSFDENLDNALSQMSSLGSQFEQIAQAIRQNPSLFVLWLYDETKYGTASMSTVLIGREPLQQAATIDMYLDAMESMFSSSQFQIDSRSVNSIGRYNAGRLVVTTMVTGSMRATTLSYIIIRNNTVWSIAYGVNSNDFEENLPIYEQSIRTIELPQ